MTIRQWLPVVALAAVIALTASLGQWQLRRAAEKDDLQAQRDEARAALPLRLTKATLGGGQTALIALDGRHVVLEGHLDDTRTVFLDNRTYQGVAGFHVLTPARLGDDGPWVMVLRGWVPRDVADRTRLPPLVTPSGPVPVVGFVQAALGQPMVLATLPAPEAQQRIWQHYEAKAFWGWSGLPVLDGIVRQTSDIGDGVVRDWTEPGSGADRHRGYAFQWYALAFAAAIAAAVLTSRNLRRR
jgi:surfeit locus 1 family protein